MTADGANALQGAEQPARAPAGTLRLLEMFLFTFVFITGGLLSWVAAFGEGSTGTSMGPGPMIPGPALTPPIPDLDLPELDPAQPGVESDFGGQIQFSTARTEVAPPTGGCGTHIDYIWEIDRSLSPPIEGQALIEVNGPDVGGDYRRPVQGDEIRLSLDVTISGSSVFEADVVSVGGVPAFPTPLQASFTDAYC